MWHHSADAARVLILPLLIVCGCTAPVPKTDTIGPAPMVEYVQEPGPYNFDCDAQSEQYKELNIRAPGGKLQITGALRFLTNRAVSFTNPIATVGLLSPRDFVPPDNQPGIRLAAWVTNGDITRFSFGHGMAQLTAFAREAFTTEAIPFVLVVDQAGKVTGSIDDIPVPGSRSAYGFERLRLTCSTAHVRFSNVTLVSLK
jgi:hypothetical protein